MIDQAISVAKSTVQGTGGVPGSVGSMAGAQGKALASKLGISGLMANLGIGRTDPDIPYRYFLEIGGVETCRFNKVSGLKMTTTVTYHREGGNNQFEHAMIEGQKYEPLVIEKAFYSAVTEFYDWMQDVHDPTKKVTRQDLSLVVLNDRGTEHCRFNFFGAFISEWEGPSFDSRGKEVTVEKIKIQFDFFEFQPADPLSILAGNALADGLAALGNML